MVATMRDGATDQVDGDVMAADLRGDHAEQMQRVGMIGLPGERLAIVRLGLGEPARLMMREAGGEQRGRARCWAAAALCGGLGGAALLAIHGVVVGLPDGS